MKKTKFQNKYPLALKRKIAQEYLEGKFSYAVAAEEYGLKSKSVVREFVRWYKKRMYLESMEKEKPCEDTPKPEAPSDELKALETELAAAKMKIASLETLIDVAEKELDIDIRKKSGTKQSK